MTTGSSQLGFRTMSSKVLFGENKTPNTRPKGLIVAACASGTGVGVVAIEDSSTTRFGKIGRASCREREESSGAAVPGEEQENRDLDARGRADGRCRSPRRTGCRIRCAAQLC